MATGVKDINDTVAASLVLQALAKRDGIKGSKRSLFGSRPAYDIVINKIYSNVGDEYAFFSYHAVKAGKAKSPTRVFPEVVLKDVLGKILGEVAGGASPVYAMGDSMNGALGAGSIDTKGIYSKAGKLGGQMQLHQAKKMSPSAYKMTQIYGLAADVKSSGVVRLEKVSYAGNSGLNIVLRGWYTRGTANMFIDRFNNKTGIDPTDLMKNMNKKLGGDIQIDYIYSPSTGTMW
ncbi:MAG: hypothetical protein IMF14_05240 [Proteobacteria bacterium]|nr:hypothetical protein [Pseudomonadota bacterium]